MLFIVIINFYFSKCSLKVVYCILDLFIQEDDELFIFFFLTAFLSKNKNEVFGKELSHIPSLLTNMNIKSIDECHEIYLLACEFRDKTPFSFRMYIDNIQLFDINRKEKKIPEKLIVMPLLPCELLYFCYSDIIKCPNKSCSNFITNNKNKTSIKNHTTIDSKDCKFCKEYNKCKKLSINESNYNSINNDSINSNVYKRNNLIKKSSMDNPLVLNRPEVHKINILILDLRQEDNKTNEIKTGFLPLTVSPSFEESEDVNVSRSIYLNYILVRRKLYRQVH